MKLSIIEVPDNKLRAVSSPVRDFTRDFHELLLDLEETLKKATNPEGVGLSFPQLGHNLRGFFTYIDRRPRFYVNPEILDISNSITYGPRPDRPIMEGCLSIPRYYGPVPRPYKVKVKALDEKGNEFTRTLSSFRARVFLHELDHLDGKLFTDYTLEFNLPLYEIKNDEFVPVKNPSLIINW